MKHYEAVRHNVEDFNERISGIKAAMPEIPWYPYGTLNNFIHMAPLITPEIDDLFAGGKRFADIGAADGDLAFFLEAQGNQCDIYDYAPTNYNTLRGINALKGKLGSSVFLTDVDLDAYFTIPAKYDLIFFLGLLYHLKNPFYVLERMARHSKYMLLSTRIARRFGRDESDSSHLAAAYLLDAAESNNDATNFWIFTDAGLKRILNRTGWDIVSYRTVGDTSNSNPQDADRDERAFCALRSRHV